MRNVLIFSVCILALAAPLLSFGQDAGDYTPLVQDCEGSDCHWENLLALIRRVSGYLITIAVPVAGGIIAIAGMYLVFNPANESKRTEAKKILWGAVIGLLIVLAAHVIIKTVLDSLEVPKEFKTKDFGGTL